MVVGDPPILKKYKFAFQGLFKDKKKKPFPVNPNANWTYGQNIKNHDTLPLRNTTLVQISDHCIFTNYMFLYYYNERNKSSISVTCAKNKIKITFILHNPNKDHKKNKELKCLQLMGKGKKQRQARAWLGYARTMKRTSRDKQGQAASVN